MFLVLLLLSSLLLLRLRHLFCSGHIFLPRDARSIAYPVEDRYIIRGLTNDLNVWFCWTELAVSASMFIFPLYQKAIVS
jgi:hypothetical protein